MGDPSHDPPGVTEAKGTSYWEPAASPDQEPGAAGVRATSDLSVAPPHPEEVEQSSPGTESGASAASGAWAAAPRMPPGATQEGLEPGRGEDLLGGPQARRGERQPAAREGRAGAPLLAAPESGGGEGKADPPLGGEPPSKEGACGHKEAEGREGAQWRHTGTCGREWHGDLTRVKGQPLSVLAASGKRGSRVAVGWSAGAGEVGDGG